MTWHRGEQSKSAGLILPTEPWHKQYKAKSWPVLCWTWKTQLPCCSDDTATPSKVKKDWLASPEIPGLAVPMNFKVLLSQFHLKASISRNAEVTWAARFVLGTGACSLAWIKIVTFLRQSYYMLQWPLEVRNPTWPIYWSLRPNTTKVHALKANIKL